MPPPTREQFNAAAAKVSASAPPGLSREDFYNLIDHELATQPSFGDDVLSTLKGEGEGLVSGLTSPFLHPIDTAKGAYNTVRHPIDTVKGISKILTEGSAEDLGQLYGNVAGGAILGKVSGNVPRVVRGIKSAAETAAPYVGPALKGAAEHAPILGPMGKGALQAVREKMASGVAPVSRLSTELAPSLQDSLLSALNEVKGSDTINDLPSRLGNVRPTANIAQKNALRVDPMSRGVMQATLPDKWGGTTWLPKDQEALLRELLATESFRKLPR